MGRMQPQTQRLSQWHLHARVFRQRRADWKVLTSPETAKASSTRRSLTATVALNRTSRDQSHPDVCCRNEHPQSRRSGPNVAGSRSQWKSRSVASIRRSPSNLKPGASVPCKPVGGLCTQDAGPFQYSSRGQGRFYHHRNRLRGGRDRKQRGVGIASVR